MRPITSGAMTRGVNPEQSAPGKPPGGWWLWIVLGIAFAARLYHIDVPPLGVHSWRQADTASIARNYFREGYDFAHPRIDFRGDGPGFVETEFPLYPFTAGVIYRLTGAAEWVPRLLSVLASVATVLVIYSLVVRIIDRKTALWSALFFAVLPLNIYYGKSIQPESWMLLASAFGVYAFSRWSEDGSPGWLAVSWVSITLACLLKVTALHLGLPLLVLAWRRRGARALVDPALLAYGGALLACVMAWYVHAYRVGQTTGNSFGILNDPKHSPWATLGDPQFYNIIIFRRLAERLFTWPGFVVLVIGVCLARRESRERLFDWWAFAVLISFGIAAFNNRIHEYYQLPFMLPGVVYMGKVYGRFWESRRVLLGVALGLILVSSVFRIVEYGLRERTDRSGEWEAAMAVRRETSPADLIIVVDAKLPTNPTLLYLCDRKGWTPRFEELTSDRIDELKARGGVVIAAAKTTFTSSQSAEWLDWLRTRHGVVHETERAIVIRLRQNERR